MIELKISVCTESVSCFTFSKLPLMLASSNAIPVDKNEITRTNKKNRYIYYNLALKYINFPGFIILFFIFLYTIIKCSFDNFVTANEYQL